MNFIEYSSKYDDDIKNLILELQEYIVNLDEDELNIVTKEYKGEAFLKTIKEVHDNEGKIFLAINNNKCIGFIAGVIVKYEAFDYLDYKCPIKGEITELIVTKEIETKGVGSQLMELMENYFKSKNCEYISLDVFDYNKNAKDFYRKKGYHSRLVSMIKKI